MIDKVEDISIRATKAGRIFARGKIYKDGFNVLGIITSSVSVAMLIIDIGSINLAKMFEGVYIQFKVITNDLFYLLFGWMDISVPLWTPTLLTVYIILGLTAARSALIYSSAAHDDSVPGAISMDSGFRFGAGKFFFSYVK